MASRIRKCQRIRVKLSISSRVSTRIFWALSILFSSFVALLALSIPDSDAWQEKFLHSVLLLVVLTNVGVNVLQVTLILKWN